MQAWDEMRAELVYITDMRVLLFILMFALPSTAMAQCVVLLHGLARSSFSLSVMEESLKRAGYRTVNPSYPSTTDTIRDLAREAIPPAVAQCGEARPVNFVTHSMGGIMVRAYVAEAKIENLGRVVMLSPPNKGSVLVDYFRGWDAFGWVNGPAGDQLHSGPNSVPNLLGPVTFELGVIAGTQSLNPFYSSIIPGLDDGKVSVESAKIDGMSDFLTLPVTHTFMMNAPLVVAQTIEFLEHGKFDPDLTIVDVVEDVVEEVSGGN